MKTRELFAKEYFELCEKHGVYIQNNFCCCGSSSIEEIPHPLPADEYSYEYDRFKTQQEDILKSADLTPRS